MEALGNFLWDSKGEVRALRSRLRFAEFQNAGFVAEDGADFSMETPHALASWAGEKWRTVTSAFTITPSACKYDKCRFRSPHFKNLSDLRSKVSGDTVSVFIAGRVHAPVGIIAEIRYLER
jgi:hypothetical protein